MALWLLKPATMVTNPDIYLNDKLLCRAISGLIPIVVFFAGFISGVQVAVRNRHHSCLIATGDAIVRLLLVEDNILIGNAVQDHLRAEGWSVDWSMDLESARGAVAAEAHDVMLLDLRLPDGSGLDLLKLMEARGETTPVIVMSAYDQLSDQMTAMNIGAVDYLVKPFALSEMAVRVRKAARRRRLIRMRNAG
ncbi:response regulator receiver domain-containing protein [Rhizobium sp. ERR 922]|nr:response regulator receiver domain-containing protein [Rhizobium sp. ERR 922]TWC04123.1 response regulator receiver domain-containing protein [Rhizobium sp. ERR 942]